jgi:hypothetical protein
MDAHIRLCSTFEKYKIKEVERVSQSGFVQPFASRKETAAGLGKEITVNKLCYIPKTKP